MKNQLVKTVENQLNPKKIEKPMKKVDSVMIATKTKKNKECPNSAMDIAEYLMSLDPERKYFTKSKIGNFRLNTMLHISQMLHCAKTGKPLFKEPMIAYPPSYHKLSAKGLKELEAIMSDNSITEKKAQISLIYKRENKANLLNKW